MSVLKPARDDEALNILCKHRNWGADSASRVKRASACSDLGRCTRSPNLATALSQKRGALGARNQSGRSCRRSSRADLRGAQDTTTRLTNSKATKIITITPTEDQTTIRIIQMRSRHGYNVRTMGRRALGGRRRLRRSGATQNSRRVEREGKGDARKGTRSSCS